MSQQVMAATITTSIGPNSQWPTYSVVGQTRNIVVQILPAPLSGYFYPYCELLIIKPNNDTTYLYTDSDSLGYARFSYTPYSVGSYSIWFYMPGGSTGLDSETYTSVTSTMHVWVVTAPLIVSASPSTNVSVTTGQSGVFTASVSGEPHLTPTAGMREQRLWGLLRS